MALGTLEISGFAFDEGQPIPQFDILGLLGDFRHERATLCFERRQHDELLVRLRDDRHSGPVRCGNQIAQRVAPRGDDRRGAAIVQIDVDRGSVRARKIVMPIDLEAPAAGQSDRSAPQGLAGGRVPSVHPVFGDSNQRGRHPGPPGSTGPRNRPPGIGRVQMILPVLLSSTCTCGERGNEIAARTVATDQRFPPGRKPACFGAGKATPQRGGRRAGSSTGSTR